MTFAVEHTFAALRQFYEVHWPESGDVDAFIHRFARERAPRLPYGDHRFLVANHAIRLRVVPDRRVVLVLYIVRAS